MYRGGDIQSHPIYNKILSIGYEFETHDLAKFSLIGDNIMVNSDLAPRGLNLLLKEKVAVPTGDGHSYFIKDSSTPYTEYFDEPDIASGQFKDGKYRVEMNITNDAGNKPFTLFLKKLVKDNDSPKNTLYSFTTDNGNPYSLRFSEELQDLNYEFTGVEFIVTYYEPEQSSNIILETFLNACKRIIQHTKSLTKIRGEFRVAGVDESSTEMIQYRHLYTKPGTNLFYLQTHLQYKERYPLSQIVLLPQMTFRTKLEDLLEVMKEITHYTVFVPVKVQKMEIMREYNTIVETEKCTIELIELHNEIHPEEVIPLSRWGNKFLIILFLILYKIKNYISYVLSRKEAEALSTVEDDMEYLKDFLGFNSRHGNRELYKTLKDLLKKELGMKGKKSANRIQEIVFQPEIVGKYLLKQRPDAATTVLSKSEEGYGDPGSSFLSYFYHFENPLGGKKDWFEEAKIDVYSTRFPLPDDGSVMVENRLFFNEISTVSRTMVDVSLMRIPSLGKLEKIYDLLTGRNLVRNFYGKDKEFNPRIGRYVKTCRDGYERDEKFKCIKTKKCKPGWEYKTSTKRCIKIR